LDLTIEKSYAAGKEAEDFVVKKIKRFGSF
jgi:hypothetical protein